MLDNGITTTKKISLAECSNNQGQLRFRDTLYVPDYPPLKLEILKLHRDTTSAGFSMRAKSFEVISREFSWP